MKKLSIVLLSLFSFSIIAQEIDASYEVPVTKELKRYATFEIAQIEVNDQNITYTLPDSLTGIPLTQLSFGSIGEGEFEGIFGKLKCTQDERNTTSCFVKYNSKYKKVLNKLSPIILDEFEGTIDDAILLEARKNVFSSFKADPLGILKFKISK